MSKTIKKSYTKPEIKKVELKPEEAVLTKCKNAPHECNPVSPGKSTFS